MITKTIKIKTINYYPVFFIGVIGTVIIGNAFSELGGTALVGIIIVFFLVVNYLFRGRLVVERIENALRFSWSKKPLFASFHEIEIHKNDFLHAHYMRGYRKPDRITIVSQNVFIVEQISSFDNNDLETYLISKIKKLYKPGQKIDQMKKLSRYYKRLNSIKIRSLFIALLSLLVLSGMLIRKTLLTTAILIDKSMLITTGIFLFSILLYLLTNMKQKRLFDEDSYAWLNL